MTSISETDRERFDRGVELSRAGSHHEALVEFQRILDACEAGDDRLRAVTHAYMGALHLHELGDAPSAEDHYRSSTQLAPQAERASIGLFLSLMEQSKTDAAFDEMRRFEKIKPSEEYARILREINDRQQ